MCSILERHQIKSRWKHSQKSATVYVGSAGEISKQLRRKRSCFRPKKSASRVLLPRPARFLLRGFLCCHGSDFGAPGADDLVGGAEDFLGALFGYHLGVRTSSTAEPILHVTPAILGSLKAQ